MRVIPSSPPGEQDDPQKFWIFGPDFVTPETSSNSSSGEDEEESRLLLLPPPPPPPRPPAVEKRPRATGKRSSAKRKAKASGGRKRSRPEAPPAPSPRPRAPASSERWTAERYERAELKVVEVMRAMKAGLGNKISRKDLRDELRKHIGDTGLLDHLLKHMAGKVVGGGGQRFMRGYSHDGVMQFWVEPAGLELSRRRGEVVDDCRFAAENKLEISQLHQRIGILTRDLDELRSATELEKHACEDHHERLLKRNRKLETQMEHMKGSFQGLEENYERLLKRNIKLEAGIAAMNSSFEGLKKEMLLLREAKQKTGQEDDKEKKNLEIETVEDPKGSTDNGACDKESGSRKLLEVPPGTIRSPQLRRAYLQMPCRGRVYVNYSNGPEKSHGHLPSLSPSLESDQQPSWTNAQCATQRH